MYDYSEPDEPVGEPLDPYERSGTYAAKIEKLEVSGLPPRPSQTLGNPVRIDVTMHGAT